MGFKHDVNGKGNISTSKTEMEVQGSSWSARERTVTARLENYLNKEDCLKFDIEELELLTGPEDSEVNLRYLLMKASRRSGRIFEIFSTKEKSEHSVANKVRWDERQRERGAQTQEERSQRSVQDDNDRGDVCWTEACEGIARRMLKFLEDSEIAKVSIRELEEQVLSPNISRINIVRIAVQEK